MERTMEKINKLPECPIHPPACDKYKAVQGIYGNLSTQVEPKTANVMKLWSDKFNEFYPKTTVQVQESASVSSALREGMSNFALTTKLISDNEIEAFEKTSGYKPTSILRCEAKLLPLQETGADTAITAAATQEKTISEPLPEFLCFYVNKDPNKQLSPVEYEFIKMILSKEGQEVLEPEGYIIIPDVVMEDLKKVK